MNPMLQMARCGAVLGLIAGTAGGAEQPTVLPRVKVNANVPLVKVAEHHMLAHRLGPAAVASGDSVYIIGGWDESSPLASVERYDVRTGKSERFAELKTARLWHSAVLIDNRIYVLGGLVEGGIGRRDRALNFMAENTAYVPTESVEIIDLASRKVERGPDMPRALEQFGAVALGRNVVTIGGNTRRDGRMMCTNAVFILNLATGAWSSGPPAPSARLAPATVIAGGLVLYAGGYNLRRTLADVDLFDPRDGTWRTLPPLCQPMSAHSLLFAGHFLFLFGSYDRPDELVAYDLKTRKSEMFRLGYTAARHTAAVIIGNRVYVVGGRVYRDARPIDLIQVFELSGAAIEVAPPAQ